MAGIFENVTKAAIDDILQSHAQATKFGFVITETSMRELSDSLYNLLLTSRNLKSAGDRMIGGMAGVAPQATKGPKFKAFSK